ncbi:M1 family metallopeptidase [Sphingobacterium sp. SYP-B4668]|uniref:M1 family metallopeptidase n=1 Tax=Sphingobacterium sp. SYP-B4668 TaxID=2996035 RepID=UPI0022DDC7B6|nr:M1 family metallopeptidase [Sphingobacterium sp. SYP-B4668]
MKKILSILLSLLTLSAFAQELYIPRNIKKAYEQGTRSTTGAPGTAYWQNKGVYDVQIKVDAATKVVSGTETILYTNNSPDTLTQVAIRFDNNVHKPNAPRANYAENDFLTSGLKIHSFAMNGRQYEVNAQDWGTVTLGDFQETILPGGHATFTISWEYPLSILSDREGQIDPSTFYLAYSYPRISVYDDYNGWDLLPHNGRQEFYNDFNDYTFRITAPKNFVVWATGIFLNPEEVLTPQSLERYKQSLISDQRVHVANLGEMKSGSVTQQNEWNVWKFKADHVTDFCFAMSDHYVWDAASVQLASKRVSIQAAYKSGTKDFEQYVDWCQYAIKWFSEHWPGIEYPYPVMTAIHGFADMEYPMMINDSSVPDNFLDARQTADHEIAHTYFPFYMGTNESRYAYMDEGWATAFEYLIGLDENGLEVTQQMFKDFRVKSWISDPSAEQDQPLISMSSQLTGVGYGNNSYIKSALSYLALKEYLGDELFKKALHHYMDNWNGKHPNPWDYFYSMNIGAGKNLNWFWNNWFFSNHYIDLQISEAKQATGQLEITVDNVGGFAVPFDLHINLADGTTKTVHYTPDLWEKTPKQTKLSVPVKGNVKKVELDGGIFMDYTPDDNVKVL